MPVRTALILLLLAGSIGAQIVAARSASHRAERLAAQSARAELCAASNGRRTRWRRELSDVSPQPPIPFGSPQWTAVQQWSEAYAAGEERLLIVLDRDGRVLVHPHLQNDDALRFVDFGARRLETPEGRGLGPMDAVGGVMTAGRLVGHDPDLLVTFLHDAWNLRILLMTSAEVPLLQATDRRLERAAWVVAPVCALMAALLLLRRTSRKVVDRDPEEGIVPPW